jgi:hypothetical protein
MHETVYQASRRTNKHHPPTFFIESGALKSDPPCIRNPQGWLGSCFCIVKVTVDMVTDLFCFNPVFLILQRNIFLFLTSFKSMEKPGMRQCYFRSNLPAARMRIVVWKQTIS